MSRHPISGGGYNLEDYKTLEELVQAHRANISPAAQELVARAVPHLQQPRQQHNAGVYKHEKNTSFSDLLETVSAELLGLANQEIIIHTDATALIQKARDGVFSAEAIVRAALQRLKVAQEVLGCCSEILEDQALERARCLDSKRAGGEPLGPLHGLPISIKGHISLKGTTSCRGYIIDCLSPDSLEKLQQNDAAPSELITHEKVGKYVPQTTAPIVQALENAGAIVICKTTMPQTVMHLDTTNNLYGQTLNPFNLSLSPGGSSGGESAAVASGASLLGLGTDIGGSIRQPCAVTGLWGLRPSCNRLSMAGYRDSSPGNIGVGAATGPMGRSLRDIQLFMSTLLAPGALDGKKSLWDVVHTLRPEPWRQVPSWDKPKGNGEKWTVGILRDDRVVRPAAPVRRAIKLCADALASFASSPEGKDLIEVKEVEPFGDHKAAWDLIRKLYFLDGGAQAKAYMSATGERPLPLTEFILSAPYVKEHNASEVFDAMTKREAYKAAYWKAWDESGIDVLLCPATPGVANRPGTIQYWGYTSQWNLLDYPGLVFPSGVKANRELDAAQDRSDGQHKFYGKDDQVFNEEYANHADMFEGMPVGLQLVGKRDEELLQAASLIAKVCLKEAEYK